MNRTLLLSGLFAAVVCSWARGEDLPPSVSGAVAELVEMCTEVQGVPQTENAVRRVDLNADDAPDFLYAGWMVCENAWSLYGDREKSIRVFAGDDHGDATEAFSDMVYDATLETAGSGARLWLTVSAEACGKPPAPTFAEEHFCDRALDWDAGAARFEYAPVETARQIE
jgi:hypothetical protein